MTTRPTRIAQTSTEVKKLYKQNGPVPSERQQRQLERAANLEKRALGIQEREERSRANRKKREEKERKEAALRRMNGVGLATQMIGYSHTQAQLKKGMETFLGYKKKSEQERKERELEVAKQLEATVEAAAKEPWDDEHDDTFDMPELSTRAGDQWMDDDLDDDTLLELHDQVMSDPAEETTETPQPRTASSAPVANSPKLIEPTKETMDFIRLHGPINKMIDSILEKFPEPLIELLSQDCSIDPIAWDPSPALLHKLNPAGLPPHRLRVKVGCVVTILRDLNSSSQLSKSQHLRILRVEKERLECLILDGQLEGTKTFLTRVSFAAKYRNEDNLPFQRIQFPIQITKDFIQPIHARNPSLTGFKKPTPPGRAPQPSKIPLKRGIQTPKAITQTNRNPSFKLPGLPASLSNTVPVLKPLQPTPAPFHDGWDDFLDTATQIARELSSEPSSPCKAMPEPLPRPKPLVLPVATVFDPLPPFSTQDFDFSLDELDDSPVLHQGNFKNQSGQPKKSVTPPLIPVNSIGVLSQPNKVLDRGTTRRQNTTGSVLKPQDQLMLKRKYPGNPENAVRSAAPKVELSAVPTKRNSTWRGKQVQTQSIGIITKVAGNVNAKRSPNSHARSMPSFNEFGLSTQEVVSFFDDDDDFGSPPIAVQ